MACDANELAEAAKCLSNLPTNVLLGIIARTLCEGTVFSCGGQSGAGSPVGSATPDFTDQLYHDTTADTYWRSTGLTSADWTEISGGGGSDDYSFTTNAGKTYADLLSAIGNKNVTGAFFNGITSLTFNKLEVTNLGVELDSLADLVSLSFPAILSAPISVGSAYLQFGQCPKLVSFDAPLLTGDTLYVYDCPLLTTLNIPSWFPANGGLIYASGNALPAAQIEAILASCVSNPAFLSGTVKLDGGTNAGLASLSVQGQADYATLFGRGVTITLNP